MGQVVTYEGQPLQITQSAALDLVKLPAGDREKVYDKFKISHSLKLGNNTQRNVRKASKQLKGIVNQYLNKNGHETKTDTRKPTQKAPAKNKETAPIPEATEVPKNDTAAISADQWEEWMNAIGCAQDVIDAKGIPDRWANCIPSLTAARLRSLADFIEG